VTARPVIAQPMTAWPVIAQPMTAWPVIARHQVKPLAPAGDHAVPG